MNTPPFTGESAPLVERPRRPRWTKKRIRTSLRLAYGNAANGGINTAAAAADLGISQRTLQRWITGDGRQTVNIDRHERLHELFATPDDISRQERVDSAYARTAITAIARPRGKGVKEIWKTRRWVEPHIVAVIDIAVTDPAKQGLKQITLTRNSPDTLATMQRRGSLTDHAVVATRFHATIIINTLLDQLTDWRINPRAIGMPAGTRIIWGEAPLPALAEQVALEGFTPDPAPQETPRTGRTARKNQATTAATTT